ncbi:MAG: tetratricopeptide repeat protein [Halopseudomonas sp.]
MAVTLRRFLKSLYTVAIACGLTLSAPQSHASHIDAYEAQHLLQWDQRELFFDSWLSAKQNSKVLFPGLLKGHSELADGYRVSKTLPSSYLTLDQLNHLWMEQAILAYQRQDWLDAQHALSQLIDPISPLLIPSASLLSQTTSIRLAEPSKTPAPITEPGFGDLFEYNRVLEQINDGQHSQAITQLAQLEKTYSAGGAYIGDRIRLLKAYSLAQTQQSEQARALLKQFGTNHSLSELSLQVEALIHLNSGDPNTHLQLLLKHSRQAPQRITQSNIRLIEELQKQGAQTQAALLASQWLLPLQLQYITLRGNVHKVSSQAFLNQLGKRQSGDTPSGLVALLSKDSRLLVTEIERLNILSEQLQGQLALLKPQQKLFNRGHSYLKAQLHKYQDLVPDVGATFPVSILKGDPAILELESRLTELVGQPDPWQQRYVLLDGLAIWHTSKPFQHRWWANANSQPGAPPSTPVDLSAASDEMANFAAEQLSKTALLEEIRIEQELPKLPQLERRAKAMLYQLDNQKLRLMTALAASLQLEPAQIVREAERNLLWLSAQIAPRAYQFDQPELQHWFDPAQPESSTLPADTQLPYELALSALQALADNALNKPTKHQAIRHLADLKLLITERILNGDPIPPRADITPQSAISLYQQLLKLSDPQIDQAQVLYQLAKAYELNGQPDQGLAALQQLLATNPDEMLLAEIQFRIAELQFGLRHFDLAEQSYRAVLAADNATEYSDKARYKLAWAAFKQGEYPTALNEFFVLVGRHWPTPGQPGQANSPSAQSLLDDTLRVIALTFAYMDGSATLQQHFAKVGPQPYEAQVYRNLAAYFEYKHRYNDAAEAFNAMVERFPNSSEAPYLQSRVVAAYTEGGFPSKAWPAREHFVERFGIDSPAWQQADPAQRDRIKEYLAGYLVELAQRDHALAQQADKTAASSAESQVLKEQHFTLALAWYNQFIEALPDDPRLAEMLFMKAEALTDTQQLPEAAIAYKQVTYQYPEYERSEEAGYAALLAYQELYRTAPAGSPKAERWLLKGIEEGLLYSKAFPDSVYTAKTQVKVAEDLLIQNEYQQAIAAANNLLQKNTALDSELNLRLWRVAAHANFDAKYYPEAEQAYQQMLLLSPSVKETETLLRRLAESIYQQGALAQSAGETVTALGHYQRLGQVVPDAHILAQADFDAATLLLQLERWPEAVIALERFSVAHAASPLQATISDKQVVAYENTQNWPKAALTLQRIFEREGDSALGRDALWRSATLQEKAGQQKLSIQAYQRYIETFPSPHEAAMEARLKLYQLNREQDNSKAEQRWLQAIVAVENSANKQNLSTDRSLFIASNAALTLGKQSMSKFLMQPLSLPLDKSLPRKRKHMEASIRYLTQTSDFGLSIQSTEATALIGQLYQQFAESLMSSQRPKKLNELELEQYEILLEEQALPFEDKSISLHEINVSRIAQEIYTPGIEISLSELRQMMPARYAKDERVPEYSDAIQ